MTATVRRLPVPISAPPFDDELPERPEPLTQGALALQFELPSALPIEPVVPHLTVVPDVEPESADELWAKPQHTASALLPDPRGWGARLAQAVVEVASGGRPAAQLVRWTDLDVYTQLQSKAAEAGRRGSAARAATSAASVRSVHVSSPADGVAEVCAVVEQGPRRRALALRLEGRDGRWQCTALALG